MEHDLLESLRRAHAEARMTGWDFSALKGRLIADDPWWDFEADCLDAMREARAIADLGTGGGERLIRLVDALPDDRGGTRTVVATEGWEPNLAVARRNLGTRSIEVLPYDAETGQVMPFGDGELDLVMSRHEGIDAGEVARVLASGGRLLTQQVDGRDAEEIHEWFDAGFAYPEVTAERFVADLEAAGMRIDQADEWSGQMRFTDVEALVIYLGYVPWDAPGFSVDEHLERLSELAASPGITVTQRRFRIPATKP